MNAYIKTRYKAKDNLTLSLDAHHFALPNAITDESGKTLGATLGQEVDLIINYGLTKVINIEGGYCAMFASSTLASAKVKNVKNADTSANWAYLMISIKPEVFIKN
jgi:hypothetical protein